MIRKLLAVTAVALAMAAVPGAAHADPGKDACKNGGYVNYLDPTTGSPFKNQGRCVSFVNAGGTLVPVQEEPPAAPSIMVTDLGSPSGEEDRYAFRFTGTGFPTDAALTWGVAHVREDGSIGGGGGVPLAVNPDGSFVVETGAPCSWWFINRFLVQSLPDYDLVADVSVPVSSVC